MASLAAKQTHIETMLVRKRALANAQESIGSRLYLEGDLEGALRHSQLALSIRNELGPHYLDLETCYKYNRDMLMAQGDFQGAAIEDEKAKVTRNAVIPDLRMLASSYTKVGWILYEKGESRAALDHYRAAVVIQQRLGFDSLTLASTFGAIGFILLKQGNMEDGILERQRAQAMRERPQAGLWEASLCADSSHRVESDLSLTGGKESELWNSSLQADEVQGALNESKEAAETYDPSTSDTSSEVSELETKVEQEQSEPYQTALRMRDWGAVASFKGSSIDETGQYRDYAYASLAKKRPDYGMPPQSNFHLEHHLIPVELTDSGHLGRKREPGLKRKASDDLSSRCMREAICSQSSMFALTGEEGPGEAHTNRPIIRGTIFSSDGFVTNEATLHFDHEQPNQKHCRVENDLIVNEKNALGLGREKDAALLPGHTMTATYADRYETYKTTGTLERRLDPDMVLDPWTDEEDESDF